MIVRTWHARVEANRADVYPKHLIQSVVPKLNALSGFRGATLLRRADGDEVEFVVQTTWDSMEAIEQFAGAAPHIAVVEPEAAAALASFDTTVTHYEAQRLA
jgi:heme-degrading monooxygenase HmoA